MTLQAWGSAAALVVASSIVGLALASLGLRCRRIAPVLGLATILIVASIAIKLPGRADTAALAVAVLIVVALGVLARLRTPPPAVWILPAALVAAAGAAIPYIANGFVGLPGVSLDNDTANHLIWAQSLRNPVVGTRYGLPDGYPLGPHSLVDTLASGLGVRLDMAMTAMLIATVILTAVLGGAALYRQSGLKRVIAGALTALLYLPAAYYAEASFKETLLGALLLAGVVHGEGLRRHWPTDRRGRLGGLIPLALLSVAALYVYSYPAAVWIVLTVALWILAEFLSGGVRLAHLRRLTRQLAPAILIGAAVGAVLLIPTAGRIARFAGSLGVSPSGSGEITTQNIGNLAHPLPAAEALGIWNSPDFRFDPPNPFHAGELAALALAVLLIGLVRSLRARELILPAAVTACAIIYWRAFHTQSPYVAAKALVIAGPVVAVTGARGLLRPPARVVTLGWVLGRLALTVVFLALCAQSSLAALRNEPAWAPESTRELLSLDRLTRGQTLLFLGDSDYAPWIFSDSLMSALDPNTVSMGQAVPSPTKPNSYGTARDFDSVSPDSINRFRWVITPNTSFASQPPAGFRLVRTLPMYELWQRVAPVAPRASLEAPGQPGAILDCHTAAGRKLRSAQGVAAVMTAPVTAPLSTILPGASDTTTLRLPAGRWQLSLAYASPIPVRVTAAGHSWRMPAYDDRPGPYFRIGDIVSDGHPVTVTLTALKPSALTGPILGAQL
ncbi:MAG TPA: hypothetical protein VFN55_03290, partial [Solirubrobacteraceae bacterium]|nr:hypothetical protein [Solirubrobacteraceae bacterium]